MAKISFAAMERVVENDLEWLFLQADASIGYRSNFPDQIRIQNKLKLDDIHQHMLNKMGIYDRKHSIERAFYQLEKSMQETLWAMFGAPVIHKPELRAAFGRYAPVICYKHPEVLKDGEIDKKQKKFYSAWLEEGRTNYLTAIESFYQKRKDYYQKERDRKKRELFRIISSSSPSKAKA